jgi:opacity protein-like surface antigen
MYSPHKNHAYNMLNNNKKNCFFIGLTLLTINLFAASRPFYAGGQFGYSNSDYNAKNQYLTTINIDTVDINGKHTPTTTTLGRFKTKTNHTHLGGRLYVGYMFNGYFSLEGGYTEFGATKINNIYGIGGENKRLSNNALDLVIKANRKLNEKSSLFAKGGLAYVMADTSHKPNSLSHMSNQIIFHPTNQVITTAYRPAISIGLDHNLSDNITTDVTYFIIPSHQKVQTSELFSVGLAYHLR